MTPRVKALVKEALSIYHAARLKYGNSWSSCIGDSLESAGWARTHPGADKSIAKKGRVIVKWVGKCCWSDNAIRDELEIHDVLRAKGFAKHLPKIYAKRGNTFIVEQFINGRVDADRADDFEAMLASNDIVLTDVHEGNVRTFMGVIKVIDGRIGYYDGEDGNGYSCDSYSDDDY